MAVGDDFSKPASPVGAKAETAGGLAGVGEARALYTRFVAVVETDGRYPLEAYRFLQEGLEFTVRRTHGEAALEPAEPISPPASDPRHVSGTQLCLGLRELALLRWGRLARPVLNAWGIHSTRDFGEMVFVLVTSEFLHKTDGDRLEDFEEVFSFEDFEHMYKVPHRPLHRTDFEFIIDPCKPSFGGSIA